MPTTTTMTPATTTTPATIAAPAVTTTWQIDPSHSCAEFAVTTASLMEEAGATPDQDLEQRRTNAVRRVSRAMTTVRSGAATLARRVPGTVRATRARASEATSVLQRLPDPTLRWLAAGSLGVAAGFQLAGAPRLVRAAGAAPALFMGAAIALRHTEAGDPSEHGA